MDPQTINAMYSFNENEISESHHKACANFERLTRACSNKLLNR